MSNLIASHQYDPEAQRLTITFVKNGNSAHYSNFPPEKYADFQGASSQGSYFHQQIRPHHPHEPA